MATYYDEFMKQVKQGNGTTTGALAPVGMERGGGGYISSLSCLKALAIKTPLQYHDVWNTLVNECESIEELRKLMSSEESDKSEKFNLNK